MTGWVAHRGAVTAAVLMATFLAALDTTLLLPAGVDSTQPAVMSVFVGIELAAAGALCLALLFPRTRVGSQHPT